MASVLNTYSPQGQPQYLALHGQQYQALGQRYFQGHL